VDEHAGAIPNSHLLSTQGDDILWALGTLGFDHYVDGMRVYLALFRETARAKEKSGAKVVDDDDDE
jgi:hypothetical protein